MSAGIRILDWTERRSGALRGFLDAEFPSGLVFHEVGVFQQNDKWWASPASKPQIGRDGMALKEASGKTKYSLVVTFSDKGRRDLWSNSVIAALRAAKPEIFT
jgi:hypothetical protein